MTRRIVHRTRGHRAGPIARFMSPSDLGEHLKPFVFLDLFEADMRALAAGMPLHPHSGIATARCSPMATWPSMIRRRKPAEAARALGASGVLSPR